MGPFVLLQFGCSGLVWWEPNIAILQKWRIWVLIWLPLNTYCVSGRFCRSSLPSYATEKSTSNLFSFACFSSTCLLLILWKMYLCILFIRGQVLLHKLNSFFCHNHYETNSIWILLVKSGLFNCKRNPMSLLNDLFIRYCDQQNVILYCQKKLIYNIQGVPQNMSDLVFGFFNPLKWISERKQGVFWKAEDLTFLKKTLPSLNWV